MCAADKVMLSWWGWHDNIRKAWSWTIILAVFWECHSICTINLSLSISKRLGVSGPYKWFISTYTSLHFQCRHVMEQETILPSLKPLVSLSLSCKRQCSSSLLILYSYFWFYASLHVWILWTTSAFCEFLTPIYTSILLNFMKCLFQERKVSDHVFVC